MERIEQYCRECWLLEEFGERILRRCETPARLHVAIPEIEQIIERFYEGAHRETEQNHFLPWIRAHSSANLNDLLSALDEERASVREVTQKMFHQRDLDTPELKQSVEELGRLFVHLAFTKAQFACNVISLLGGREPSSNEHGLEPWSVVLKAL